MVPDSVSIRDAVRSNPSLIQLQARIQQSTRLLELARPCMPAALAKLLRAGPLDEAGWSILAENAAAAAKLRQLEPRIRSLLQEHGQAVSSIRIKVQASQRPR